MAVKTEEHTMTVQTEDNEQPKPNKKRAWGDDQGKGSGPPGAKRKEENYEWSTVKVENVPLNTHRRNLEKLLASYGSVKKSWVLKAKPGGESTIGFVTFRSAKEAMEVVNVSLEMKDNPLTLSLAPNTKIHQKLARDTGSKNNDGYTGNGGGNTGKDGGYAKKDGGNTKEYGGKPEVDSGKTVKDGGKPEEDGGKTVKHNVDPAIKKQKKQQYNARKSRLILRNLSYKATDEGMREHFGKYGELDEVNILKKADGKIVGCAFIQYKNKNHAVKAIKEMNGKKFLGKPVALDWAVPKEVYKAAVKEEEIKDEPLEIKEEELDESEIKVEDDGEIKVEDDGAPKPKRQKILNVEIKEEDESDIEDDGSDNEDDDDSGNESDVKDDEDKSAPTQGHDVDERKTVFIKNLSFDSDEEDLYDMMVQVFGPIFFAKIVMNKEMNHSKGTAFVKFKNVSDAEECVKVALGADGLFLDKRQLDVQFAMKKEDVTKAVEERKKKEEKDKRNLYLANEGLIREGTKAAEGVSKTDMSMRKFLLKQKKELLKNLHMFVSTTRLIVRNLPFNMDDRAVKKMFLEHSPEKSRIVECRIMKESSVSDTSKGFAFVNFNRHEDALAALRNLNNNPEVFGANHRPIIDFSIEDRKALTARARRAELSKMKNPTYIAKYGNELSNPNIRPLGQGKIDSTKLPLLKKGETKDFSTEDFGGSVANPNKKDLPRHLGDKGRERNKKISRSELKKGQRNMKNPSKRKRLAVAKQEARKHEEKQGAHQNKHGADLMIANPAKKMRKDKIKKAKQDKKKVAKARDDKFESLVNKYKKDLVPNKKVLKKWFD